MAERKKAGGRATRRRSARGPKDGRSFAEVYRGRSLLFLGSGIREPYLQELFGEILEMYGPSARPHYALMIRSEADPDFVAFMRSRFGTIVVPYDQHAELPRMLGRLARAAERASRRPMRWSFGSARPRPSSRWVEPGWEHDGELHVVRGPLPLERRHRDECLVVSAGGEDRFFAFSEPIERGVLPAWGVRPGSQPRAVGRYVGRFPARPVFAVRARSDSDERGLGLIHDACLALFDEVHRRGFRRVLMQLVAAGGRAPYQAAQAGGVPFRTRTFPERFSFIQMVRAFADWRARRPERPLELTIFLVAAPVYREIASGRLDVLELLESRDVRFWAEVLSGPRLVERRLYQWPPESTLRDVVDDLDLPHAGWDVQVSPAPNLAALEDTDRAVENLLTRDLAELGIVPGSTLRFWRRAASPAGSS